MRLFLKKINKIQNSRKYKYLFNEAYERYNIDMIRDYPLQFELVTIRIVWLNISNTNGEFNESHSFLLYLYFKLSDGCIKPDGKILHLWGYEFSYFFYKKYIELFIVSPKYCKDLVKIIYSLENPSIDLIEIYHIILGYYNKLSCKIIYTLFLTNVFNIEINVNLIVNLQLIRTRYNLHIHNTSPTFAEITNDFINYKIKEHADFNMGPFKINKFLNTIIRCCNFNKYKYTWILLVLFY